MQGTYSGVSLTWLDPAKPAVEAPARATAKAILGDKFLRIETATRTMGQANKGVFILGHDPETKSYHCVWMDSFHMAPSMMFCKADKKANAKEISVLGDYSDGAGGRWGWRTSFAQPDSKTLLIKAFNVPPGQKEQAAVELRLKRVK